MAPVPHYLRAHSDLWVKDPKAANLAWWRQARFGLFIHYGLYSQLGEGEWVQFKRTIPVAKYDQLRQTFDPKGFDAEAITDLALAAEMRYVTLVCCHHDSFTLWPSSAEPFNISTAAPGRDLVGELAQACDRKGLGFFTYYTYALNWRHPWYMSREFFAMARPAYAQSDPHYRFRGPEDLAIYWQYVHACLTELLTRYTPLAGVWLDLIMGYYARPDLIPVEETYALIRRLQPQALISYKQGANGDEDFATPEHNFASLAERAGKHYGPASAQVAATAWERNRHKHNEICTTLHTGGWGYVKDAVHKSADEIFELVRYAGSNRANLLANVGPLPDGSIHPADVAALHAVGDRIRREGWPTGAVSHAPGNPVAAGAHSAPSQ